MASGRTSPSDVLQWAGGVPYIGPSYHRAIDAVKYHEIESIEIWNVGKEAIRINLHNKAKVMQYVHRRLEQDAYIFIV